jgi:transposase InsO family protein
MEIRLLAVQACEAGILGKEVAELAGVSTSTMSSWWRAYREKGIAGLAPRTNYPSARKICTELENRIKAHKQAHPEHGVRRVRDELRRDQGLSVSAETVRRVVNDAGLGNPPPKAKRRPVQVRRFERSIPNAMWQIDIFTFQLKRMYPVYLVGIIDDHSRYIVGHGLYRQQKADAVLEVVKGAVGEWGAPREILSDNGRQFVAWRGKSAFQKLLVRQGIGHVRSAPQHPMTLGKIERFWKTVWNEFLQDAVFASFADATQRLAHWIAYYNHQRPHQGIGGVCPADRFYGMADDIEAAVGQGCRENSLRLALGQEPEPPLYLLGKLGGTDVRVTRKGEEIEVQLGDQVHEVIRVGSPYTLDEHGEGKRGEADDEVERSERRGAVPGGGDGPQGGGAPEGDLRDVWGVAPDVVPGDAEGRRGVRGSPGAEAPWTQGQDRGRAGDGRAERPGGRPPQGDGALEDQVRDRQDLPRPGAEVRPWGAPGRDVSGQEQKKPPTQEEEGQVSEEIEPSLYDLLCWTGDDDEGGSWG